MAETVKNLSIKGFIHSIDQNNLVAVKDNNRIITYKINVSTKFIDANAGNLVIKYSKLHNGDRVRIDFNDTGEIKQVVKLITTHPKNKKIIISGKKYFEDSYVVDDGGGSNHNSEYNDVSYSYGLDQYQAQGATLLKIFNIKDFNFNDAEKILFKMYRKVVPEYYWIEYPEKVHIYVFNNTWLTSDTDEGRWGRNRFKNYVLNNLGEKVSSAFIDKNHKGWVEWDITEYIKTLDSTVINAIFFVIITDKIHFSRFYSTDFGNEELIPKIELIKIR
ncbi:hypothetical protein KA977_07160 [Candidatus Dependentiae bacterium]|nr:hypothetical protein [Candidatus Dependentiae bacterium]